MPGQAVASVAIMALSEPGTKAGSLRIGWEEVVSTPTYRKTEGSQDVMRGKERGDQTRLARTEHADPLDKLSASHCACSEPHSLSPSCHLAFCGHSICLCLFQALF